MYTCKICNISHHKIYSYLTPRNEHVFCLFVYLDYYLPSLLAFMVTWNNKNAFYGYFTLKTKQSYKGNTEIDII